MDLQNKLGLVFWSLALGPLTFAYTFLEFDTSVNIFYVKTIPVKFSQNQG